MENQQKKYILCKGIMPNDLKEMELEKTFSKYINKCAYGMFFLTFLLTIK